MVAALKGAPLYTIFLFACLNLAPVTLVHADTLLAQADAGAGAGAKPDALDRPFIVQILDNPFVLPVALLVIFYITFLGPERKRRAEEARMLAAMQKNDRVVTRGGIHATIVAAPADSDIITLKIDEAGSTRVKVDRSAIVSVMSAAKAKETDAKATA